MPSSFLLSEENIRIDMYVRGLIWILLEDRVVIRVGLITDPLLLHDMLTNSLLSLRLTLSVSLNFT